MKTPIFKADILLLLAATIWGGAFVAQRAGMEHLGPLTFNGIRFALGAAVLWPPTLRTHSIWRSSETLPNRLGISGAIWGGILAGTALFCAATLQQVGLVFTTAGKAGFITGLYVVMVPIIGTLFGYSPGWGSWIGAALAALGLYFLSVTESLTFAPGDLWEVAGAFFWAVHVLILGWLSPKMDGLRLARHQYTVCALLSLLLALGTETVTLSGLRNGMIPILYGGVLSVGLAYTLQVVAQRDAPPSHAAILLSLEAVFAAVAGWLVLGESLTSRDLLGCALMLTGMLIAQLWVWGIKPPPG